jgi:hypothetical protein
MGPKRYGPKVEGADVHHNPTPGRADSPYQYGHVWVTISLALRHPKWGAIGLPLLAMLYVREQTMASIPQWRRWGRFATKLQLAARLVEWIAPLMKRAHKTVWIVVDGGYTKRPFLKRATKTGVTIIGRLRRDAALRDLPPRRKKGAPSRSRPTAQIWQEEDQSGQARRTKTRLALDRLHGLRPDGDQDVQNLSGNLRGASVA